MGSNVRTRLENAVLAAMDCAETSVMQWGRDDCALWVADIVRDVFNYDPAEKMRGRYVSRIGALRVLAANGGLKGILQAAARRHNWTRIDPERARPGDVGLAWTLYDQKPSLATVVCRAAGWFVGRNERGWTAMPAHKVVIAWCVADDCWPGAPVRPSPLLRAPPVQDPVTIGLSIAGFLSITGISTGGAFLLGVLALGALGVGFSLLSSLLMPQTGFSLDDALANSAAAQGAQVTERQAIPYKRVIVGNAFVGGALFFEQVKPPYLTLGILVNYGKINSIEGVRIGTNKLILRTIPENTILTPLPNADAPDYSTHLLLCVRHGDANQSIDPLIAQEYPAMASTFRQRGNATVTLRCKHPGTYETFTDVWGQVQRPSAYFTVNGVAVYDPRDPLQVLQDESTWKWSDNASLIQAWYLTRPYGGRIPVDKIDWDKVAESADYDDELIGCKDGTLIKRHTINGTIKLNETPYTVITKLLTANRGGLYENAGLVWVASSRPETPLTTISDKVLTGGIKYQAAKAKKDLINKLQVRFATEDDHDRVVTDGPVLSRADLQEADGEVLPATLTLEYTRDHRRAQRLQKAFLASSRLGKTIQCSVDIRIMEHLDDELIGKIVNFESALFAKANGTYRVTGVGFSDDFMSLSLALAEYDRTIEHDWNPTMDEQDFTLADLDVS